MAIDTLAHGVLSDLLSATGNNMDITLLAPNMGSTESTQVFLEVGILSYPLGTASKVLARLPGQAAASHTAASLQPSVRWSNAWLHGYTAVWVRMFQVTLGIP